MRLIINIPDKETIKPCTFYFTVACKNEDIEVSSTDYFKEKYGIEFRIEKGGADMRKGSAESLDYQRAVEDAEYCERYEPTYNPNDGSM